jgi:hypothetical protein
MDHRIEANFPLATTVLRGALPTPGAAYTEIERRCDNRLRAIVERLST